MAKRTCSIEGCSKPSRRRNWCNMHYNRWNRHGDPLVTLISQGPAPERFWQKVDVGHPLGCWEWLGAKARGYGHFNAGDKRYTSAHRWAFETLRGTIPDGLQLDHLCRNRSCVNPDHLEPVTQEENIRRGYGISAANAEKTHCPQGHPYNEANTYRPKRGGRQCKECSRMRTRESRLQKSG